MKFSEMISNQSTAGLCLRMYGKWTVRRPTPRPRFGCPRRGRGMAAPGVRAPLAPKGRGGKSGRLLLLLGGVAELLVGLLHGGLVVVAGLLPGLVRERHAT